MDDQVILHFAFGASVLRAGLMKVISAASFRGQMVLADDWQLDLLDSGVKIRRLIVRLKSLILESVERLHVSDLLSLELLEYIRLLYLLLNLLGHLPLDHLLLDRAL